MLIINGFGVSRMERRLMALNEEISEVVQIPAIVSSGAIKMLQPEMLKMDTSLLKAMAVAMGGELVYMKLRAKYSELEVPLCSYNNCYRPAKDLWCEDHPNGQSKSHSHDNVRPLVNPRTQQTG